MHCVILINQQNIYVADQPWWMYVIFFVGIQKGSLSPRPSRTLQQSREQWYSVPPALGPLYHDFATTQLASIAQHKKQSQDSLPSVSSPPLSGSAASSRQKGKLQHSSSTGS